MQFDGLLSLLVKQEISFWWWITLSSFLSGIHSLFYLWDSAFNCAFVSWSKQILVLYCAWVTTWDKWIHLLVVVYVNYIIILCLVSYFKRNLNFDFIYRNPASPTPFVGSNGKQSPTLVCSDLPYTKTYFWQSQSIVGIYLLFWNIFKALFILCIPKRTGSMWLYYIIPWLGF